jgi:hypothetical protein
MSLSYLLLPLPLPLPLPFASLCTAVHPPVGESKATNCGPRIAASLSRLTMSLRFSHWQ